MKHARALGALFVIGLLVLAGCSSDHGTTAMPRADRTIDVGMTDNAFNPTTMQVRKGETVMFRFRNNGKVRHEAVIGDAAKQDAHHRDMTASTGSPGSTGSAGDGHGPATEMGGHGAGNPDSVTVDPGKSGEITHTFDRDGTLMIGCHEPGHWEAGMKMDLTIT